MGKENIACTSALISIEHFHSEIKAKARPTDRGLKPVLLGIKPLGTARPDALQTLFKIHRRQACIGVPNALPTQ